MKIEIEAEHVRCAISLAVLAFLVLCAALKPLREWMFGRPYVNDDGGFPWSRNRERRERGRRRHDGR
jgi:hypothetical protein